MVAELRLYMRIAPYRGAKLIALNAQAANAATLLLLVFGLAEGLGSFLIREPNGRRVFWLHRVGGLALVVLLGWKASIAARLRYAAGQLPDLPLANPKYLATSLKLGAQLAMGRRKTEILSFSVPPGMKKEVKELAEEQGMGTSELFWEMVQV